MTGDERSLEFDDPLEELGSTLSNSTSSPISHDWLSPSAGGLPAAGSVESRGRVALAVGKPAPDGGATPPDRDSVEMSADAALYEIRMLGATQDLREAATASQARANLAFYCMLGFGVGGGIAVLVGIGLTLGQVIAPGVLTVVGGVVSGGVFEMFRRMYRDERGDVEEARGDMRMIQKARLQFLIATQIAEANARDEAIRKIAADLRSMPARREA